MDTNEKMKAALAPLKAELEAERDAINAQIAPLQAELDAIVARIQPLEAQAREVRAKIKALERPRLKEVGDQLAEIARVLGAKTLRNG